MRYSLRTTTLNISVRTRPPPCLKLKVNGRTITDREGLLQAWENHYTSLSRNRITRECNVLAEEMNMEALTSAPLSHVDYVLDIEFAVEEISIITLPNGKAAGPNGVCSKHLKFDGSSLNTWLTQIFNAILLLVCPLFLQGG